MCRVPPRQLALVWIDLKAICFYQCHVSLAPVSLPAFPNWITQLVPTHLFISSPSNSLLLIWVLQCGILVLSELLVIVAWYHELTQRMQLRGRSWLVRMSHRVCITHRLVRNTGPWTQRYSSELYPSHCFQAVLAQVAASLRDQQYSFSGIIELDDNINAGGLKKAMEDVKLGDVS